MKETHPQPQQSPGEQSDSTHGAGTPVIADVFARKDGGRIKFDLRWRFENDAGEREDPIDIPPKKYTEPGTMIHFHLHDRTGRGLAFDPVHPIWVSRAECPEDWSADPEIPKDGIDRHPKLLKVLDRNQDKCELHFALVFEDHQGNRVPFDPRIINGGSL